ncbi:MATE family efflux transporter [Peptoniphilus stercorisuis]|uniref:Multidrug export protein MepA n=1 Tax=Peptoniphilus stercorisuis TaxID=1436965 RepID=A0ABS4KCS4_9FIRM|nr:MATE family efflux transporter [Peptoniphilus stercorisuis]MBP2025565.1 putative MATE family efflux protein [Peptoniphilus stercorisuis]
MEKNKLGTENIKGLLFSLALPAIIGQMVSLLYNIVDRIYIGHIKDIGGLALTGVGVTAPILLIISAFAVLVGMGGAPRASIAMGKKDNDAAEKIIGNCLTTLIGISILLSIFFLIFNEKLLMLFGASENTIEYALEYMNIYTFGIIFVQMTLGMNPFISAQGFAKTSMITVSIGAVINIVLDPIFIFGFDMGVRGAAFATIISQGVSAIWVLYFLTGKKTNLKIKKKNLGFNSKVMGPVLLLGLSPFVMQFTESFIIILFNAKLQRYGGDVAVGAMTITTTAMQFLFLPLSGLTQGSQPIISYNYGAKNKSRVKDTFKYLLFSAITYSLIFYLFIMIFPGTFASIFTKNQDIIREASKGLRVYMSVSFLMGIQVACQQTFIALGNARSSVFLAFLRKVFLLMPLVIILPRFFERKVFAVFLAEPIADIIAVTVTSILFYKFFKQTLENIEETV